MFQETKRKPTNSGHNSWRSRRGKKTPWIAFSENPFSPTSTNDHMKRLIKSFALSLTFACLTAIADDNVTTKHTLTLEGARKAGEAAAAFAKQNSANPAIAVVDEGGH